MRKTRPRSRTVRVGPEVVSASRAFAAILRLAGVDEPRELDPDRIQDAVKFLEPWRREQLLEEIARGPARGSRKGERLAARGF